MSGCGDDFNASIMAKSSHSKQDRLRLEINLDRAFLTAVDELVHVRVV
jgi:hypothetical protein